MAYLIEFGSYTRGYFYRNYYVALDEHYKEKQKKYIEKHKHTDIYTSAYHYESNDIDHCALLGNVYFDLDSEDRSDDAYNKIVFQTRMLVNYFTCYMSLKEENMQIFFSGHKGFHIVLPHQLFGIKPSVELNMDFKQIAHRIAKEYGITRIDTSIYDRKRLFRLPNTINSKSKLYKVPVSVKQLYTFSREDMMKWAAEPRECPSIDTTYNRKAAAVYQTLLQSTKKKIKSTDTTSKIPEENKELLPCAERLLKAGIGEGSRNNAAIILASSLIQAYSDIKEAWALLELWNAKNEPPLSTKELYTTFNSALTMAQNGKGYGCAAYKEIGMCVGRKCKLLQWKT